MAVENRTYGEIQFADKRWQITAAQPHVIIKLKAILPHIPVWGTPPFYFNNTPANGQELLWFMDRYPLKISKQDLDRMKRGKKEHIRNVNALEQILTPDYIPKPVALKPGYKARDYQLRGCEAYLLSKRLLIGDDLGLGKTLIAILSFLDNRTLPALVTVQTHLTKQWKEQIEKFTDLSVHIIEKTTPYKLPKADIYISRYTCLAGWSSFFGNGYFKSAVFDEMQELRHNETNKYGGARALCNNVKYALRLTATPMYNFGNETFNLINLLNPGSLGTWDQFAREWTNWGKVVKEPVALGTMLRERMLFLRRTRAEVGRELPPVNKIVHTVEHNSSDTESSRKITEKLALSVFQGSFMERGMAARELDIRLRQETGIGKARSVAQYVKILLDSNEPVLLAGWHRDVYEIWMKELAEYNPVMYTGSETTREKNISKDKFMNGETNLMIISLRSGIGLDGLQFRCKYVVFGELDWSPKVHDQVIARADRDGQKEQVTAIYLVTEYGSDPVVIDLLGVKASQSHNIIDPMQPLSNNYTDDSRIKLLAEHYLKSNGIEIPSNEPEPV